MKNYGISPSKKGCNVEKIKDRFVASNNPDAINILKRIWVTSVKIIFIPHKHVGGRNDKSLILRSVKINSANFSYLNKSPSWNLKKPIASYLYCF